MFGQLVAKGGADDGNRLFWSLDLEDEEGQSSLLRKKDIRAVCESGSVLGICELISIPLFLYFHIFRYVNYTNRNTSLFWHVSLLFSSKHSFRKASEILQNYIPQTTSKFCAETCLPSSVLFSLFLETASLIRIKTWVL